MNKSERTLLGVLPHDTLKEHKINFVSLKEQMDTDTGMLMFNMMGSIAEFERCLINRRIYEGVKISGRKKLGHST